MSETTGGRRVLVTGISSPLAGQLAARLEDDDRVEHVVGVDVRAPGQELTRTEFVRANMREADMAGVLDNAGIDTVVHTHLLASPAEAGGRTPMKELNVIGTMQLLAAVQRAAGVRRLLVRSSTAVYGSTAGDPALLDEAAQPRTPPRGPTGEDVTEIERCVRGFARRRPDVAVSILRFAELVGPTVESPLTRAFGLPVVPTVLGRDPRLQLCHEADAADITHALTVSDHPGTYNVAAPGVVYVSQALRLAGKPGAPMPPAVAAGMAGLARRTASVAASERLSGLADVELTADQLELLTHGRVANIDRLREQTGLRPRFSTREAFEDFLASGRVTPMVDYARLDAWQARLGRLARSAVAPEPRRDRTSSTSAQER